MKKPPGIRYYFILLSEKEHWLTMKVFLASFFALLGVASARNASSMERGRRAEEGSENAMLDFTSDAEHHKGGSKSSDDFKKDDFTDNSRGYCKLDKLDEIDTLDILIKTNYTMVRDFMYEYQYDDGTIYREANSDLKEWVKLVKKYLPKDYENFFIDEEILQTVMRTNMRGEKRFLSADCATAIHEATVKSIADFNTLMNVGDAFIAPNDAMISTGDAIERDDLTVLLAVVENGIANPDTTTFEIFINYVLHYYAVYNAEKYFNTDFLDNVKSWQELALTPVSITAKFAAVQLTWGTQLEATFDADMLGTALQNAYNDVFTRCNAPTQFPSTAPSFSPATADKLLTVVAVASKVKDDVSEEEIAGSFTLFRTTYPDRRFCLLQPVGFAPADLKASQAFFLDDLTTYVTVNLDDGDPYKTSNWYDLCKLQGDVQGISDIPYFIGSTDIKNRVEKSEDFFEDIVAARGQTIVPIGTTAPSGELSGNWISPFLL